MCLSNSLSRILEFACLILFLTTSIVSQAHAGKRQQSNTAPAISGVPTGSVSEGSEYVFRPGASDPDGDSLTFSIQNRPTWARFNRRTGRLRGVPTNSDIGSYSNIRISVSDGKVATTLPAFSITVNNTTAQKAAVFLSWLAPTTRADGTPLPLTELDGYTVYYGPAPGSYTNSINIDDPYTTSVTVTELPVGVYYFVLTSRNTIGLESDYSGTISRQVN